MREGERQATILLGGLGTGLGRLDVYCVIYLAQLPLPSPPSHSKHDFERATNGGSNSNTA